MRMKLKWVAFVIFKIKVLLLLLLLF